MKIEGTKWLKKAEILESHRYRLCRPICSIRIIKGTKEQTLLLKKMNRKNHISLAPIFVIL